MKQIKINGIQIPLTEMFLQEIFDVDEVYENWLNDSHVDWLLMYFQKRNSHVKILYCYEIEEALANGYLETNFENTENLIIVQCVSQCHWITLTNIELEAHVPNFNGQTNIYMYDSLNESTGIFLQSLVPLFQLMYTSLNTLYINRVIMKFTQQGKSDCGLYCLSYVYSLLKQEEPAYTFYSNDSMRRSYNKFILGRVFSIPNVRLYSTSVRDYETYEIDISF